MKTNPSSFRAHRGSVLILALWVMIFFGALVAVFSVRVNSQLSAIRRITESVRGRIQAYSGIGYVLGVIREKKDAAGNREPFPSAYWLANEKLFHNIPLSESTNDVFSIMTRSGSASVYGLKDEESKININKIEEEVFHRIYACPEGLMDDDAKALAKETIKYRQEKGDFASPEELLLVSSMTGELFDKLKSHLTVLGSGQVNLNTVSKETLILLGIAPSLAGRILDYRDEQKRELPSSEKDQMPEDPFKNLGDLTQKIGVSPEEDTQLQNIASLWTSESTTFRFQTLVSTPDGRIRAGFECVANRKGEILFLSNA